LKNLKTEHLFKKIISQQYEYLSDQLTIKNFEIKKILWRNWPFIEKYSFLPRNDPIIVGTLEPVLTIW